MQQIVITIPTSDAFRAHLMIAFLYMITYFNEKDHIPDYGIEEVLDVNRLAALRDKLLYAEHKESLEITFEELMVIYSTVHLMIKLLLSQHDEVLFDKLVAELPDDVFHEHEKETGSFTNFRNNVIQANVRIIKDTEEKFHDFKELDELKAKLDEIHIH